MTVAVFDEPVLLQTTGRFDELAKGLIWARRCCMLAVVALGIYGTGTSPVGAEIAKQFAAMTAQAPQQLALSQSVAVPAAQAPAPDLATAAANMADIGFKAAGAAQAVTGGASVDVSAAAPAGAQPKLFVAGGARGFAAVSPDAKNWTVVSTGFGGDILAMADGAGRTVAVGEGGRVAVSRDGMSWSSPVSPAVFGGENITGVAFATDRFVAVTASGVTAVSKDGVTWTAMNGTAQPAGDAAGRVYTGSGFLQVGASKDGRGQIVASRDGKTAEASMVIGPAAFNAIAMRL